MDNSRTYFLHTNYSENVLCGGVMVSYRYTIIKIERFRNKNSEVSDYNTDKQLKITIDR